MVYKGIYRDGIVTLLGDVDLRNGATVDVNLRGVSKRGARAIPRSPRAKANARTKTRDGPRSRSSAWDGKLKQKMTKKQRIAAILAARGTWKDRPDWKGKSTVEIATLLRQRASRRVRSV